MHNKNITVKRFAGFLAAAAMLVTTACGTASAQNAGTASAQAAETASVQAAETAAASVVSSAVQETETTGVSQGDSTGRKGNGGQGGPNGHQGNGGRGGAQDKSSDTELQTMIAEVAPKFELLSFEDEESGTTLQYQLYVPEDYDASQSYPLLQFIPDSSVVGKSPETVLTQGWGGLVFATEEEQAKHPSFVVVPVFSETVVNDSFEHSEQIETAVRLLLSLTEQYSIDTDRIYTTGQSMGGMTSFYLNTAYPDLFAASLFVGSQWDNSILDVLEDKDFFYIVSAGDPKASAGQAGLIEVFDEDQAAYSAAEWSARDPQDTQNAAVKAMLSEGNNANFVTFTLGTTLAEGSTASGGAGEHMTSFDYAYKLEAVRDWLYSQSKH